MSSGFQPASPAGDRGSVSLLIQNGLPGQVLAGCFIQVLKAGLIGRQEHECILEKARCVAAAFQELPWPPFLPGCRLLAVGILDPKHHQPRIQVVLHVRPGLRQGMDAVEIALLAQVGPQAFLQFLLRPYPGSRFNCSARSSASLVTVGWVEYQ